MVGEKKPRFILGLMTVASIVSISLLLQVGGNLYLNSIVMLLLFYTVLPAWICRYYFQKRGVTVRQVVFFRGIARWVLPIAEEFVFRGVILNQMMGLFGSWKGIGFTSLIFAVFHLNFFGAFLFAVIASLLYVKTGNLLAPILLHLFNNTLAAYQAFVDTSFMGWLTVTSVNELYTKAAPNFIALLVSTLLLLLLIGWLARGLETAEQPLDKWKA